ncbi:hypothetical protein LTR78_006798 [Recurvomyces mirabilis]|uniref:Uncharacterized protein n=1 Tax=Recurvomyces mirabilis TaxID=574656 RepID=A0AAE1BZB0_9PEZI|nr:hypothetical protein LTR78_006798 [Recurvomyces mirabilis]KAK5153212.1 hypothetical protein LTS14_007857 [Recurvomyces mirabilis]
MDNQRAPNKLVLGLYTDFDPTKLDTFGTIQYKKITRASVIARRDEGPEVNALLSFLNKISHGLRTFSYTEFESIEAKQKKDNETEASLFTAQTLAKYAVTHFPAA